MTSTTVAPPGADARPRGAQAWGFVSSRPVLVTWVAGLVVLLAACLGVDRFATSTNISAWLTSVAVTGIVAAGMSWVTVAGRYFLLSVGAMAASSGMVFAHLLQHGVWVALLGAGATGLLCGLLQGAAIGWLGTDPILTTVAGAALLVGVGQLVTGGLSVTNTGDASWLATGQAWGVPSGVLVLIGFAVISHLWLEHTRTGRVVRLVGRNTDAARAAGLPVERAVLVAYGVAGVACGVAGGLLAAEGGQGSVAVDAQLGFSAIAAIVVGGVSVAGGRGRVVDAVFGAAFIGLVANVLLLQGYSLGVQWLVQGVVLALALALTGLAGKGGTR